MIIVDLDKLHFPFTTARPEYAQGVQDLHKAILKCKIDAIPVEWIEKQIQTVCDNIEAETFGKWLIKEWEKENEENIHA